MTELVKCPVCRSGGVPTTFVGRHCEELKCVLCRGKHKVPTEIESAYRLIRGELTPWDAGKLLRETAPALFPQSWLKIISSALTRLVRKEKEPDIVGVRFPYGNKPG